MDDLGIKPPMAPGNKNKSKGGLFSKLFKKKDEDVQDVRITEEHLNSADDLDSIRKQVGIEAETAPEAETINEVPEEESPVPSPLGNSKDETLENPPSPAMPEAIDEKKPEMAPEAEMPEAPKDEMAPPAIEEELTPPPRIDKGWLDSEEKQEVAAESDDSWTEEAPAPEAQAGDDQWTEETASVDASEESAWSDTPQTPSVEEAHDELAPINDAMGPMGEPEDDLDELEDLKRLHDELSERPSFIQQENAAPESQISHDWASDEPIALDSGAEPESTIPPHHEPIEAAMADIGKKHKKLDDELKKVKEVLEQELPDWKLQKKEVLPHEQFTLKNGQKLGSFRDLLEALSFIDEETFNHHVTEDRNDFAEWIEHILEEEKLAEKIRNKKAREELLKILRQHEEKVHKDAAKQQKALDKEIEKRKKKTKKIRELEKKLAKLVKELENKSADLRALRGTHGKQIKEHIDSYVEDRIGDARAELDMKHAEVEGRAKALDEQDSAIDDRHKVLKDIEKTHQSELAKIEQARARFEAEMCDAHELVAEAEKIKAEKEDALAARKEAKDALAEQKKQTTKAVKVEKAAEAARKRAEKAEKKLAEDKKAFMAEKKEVTALKKELDKRAQQLDKQKSDANKAVEKMKAERQLFSKEKKEIASYKRRELASLEKRRSEVEKLIDEVESRTEEYKEVVKKNESTLEKNQGILDEVERLRDDIKQRSQDSEKRSMKAYLQSKLDETVTDGLTSSPLPAVDEVSNVKLYRMIDECKQALDANKLTEARSLYNKLRTEFGSTKLSSHEKSVLYNSIRELYDDIHLAMLNQ